MAMRKLFTIILYTIILLIIGRNLPSLPRISVLYDKALLVNTDAVRNDVDRLAKKQKGTYSILYKSLTSTAAFGINESQQYTGASVNKVHIVSALYYLADRGKINLDGKITLQKKDIQDYGTGSLRYQKPGTVYSLKTLTRLALQQSDNTAAKIIATKIGMKTIQKLMEEFGLTQTDMENNKTSLPDTLILFQKIYNNDITSPSLSKELLGFMKDTDIEDRLPRFLPPTTTVYHKTGDTIGGVHDVGIIKDGDTIFFLGVMTTDINDSEKETKVAIGKISKLVFYFSTKKQ